MKSSQKLKTLSSIKRTQQYSNIHPKLATINQLKTLSHSPITHISKTLKRQEKPMCAFHQEEIITNFCRRKKCLLPLCPKCVTIHTQEHIKLGFHGEFTTIEDEITQSEKQIFLSMQKISQVQQIMINKNQEFQRQITNSKQIIKSARVSIHEAIDQTFDDFQKAWFEQYERINKKVLKNISFISEYLPTLTQMANRGLNKLKNTLQVLEGVITNFSFLQHMKQLESQQSILNTQKINKIDLQIQESQIKSLVDCIEKYITWGQYSKNIDSKSSLKDDRTLAIPIKQLNRIASQRKDQGNSSLTHQGDKLQKTQSFQRGLTLNLSLDTFKSPLQSFSLQNFRKNQTLQL